MTTRTEREADIAADLQPIGQNPKQVDGTATGQELPDEQQRAQSGGDEELAEDAVSLGIAPIF